MLVKATTEVLKVVEHTKTWWIWQTFGKQNFQKYCFQMKKIFWLKFQWNFYQGVQLKINGHWFSNSLLPNWYKSLSDATLAQLYTICPDSKVHRENMGPTWVLSAPDGPYVGPMNLAIRVSSLGLNELAASNIPSKNKPLDRVTFIFIQNFS